MIVALSVAPSASLAEVPRFATVGVFSGFNPFPNGGSFATLDRDGSLIKMGGAGAAQAVASCGADLVVEAADGAVFFRDAVSYVTHGRVRPTLRGGEAVSAVHCLGGGRSIAVHAGPRVVTLVAGRETVRWTGRGPVVFGGSSAWVRGVREVDLGTGAVRRVGHFGTHADVIAVAQDESLVAVRTPAGLRIVDATSGRVLGRSRVGAVDAAWMPSGRLVVAGRRGVQVLGRSGRVFERIHGRVKLVAATTSVDSHFVTATDRLVQTYANGGSLIGESDFMPGAEDLVALQGKHCCSN
jgi:hypothetical protein